MHRKKRLGRASLFLLPSPLRGKIKDFDKLKTQCVISGDRFKSWNDDPVFRKNGFNAMYFRYTKPYKVEVEFIVGMEYGIIDIVLWDPEYPQFIVKPMVLHAPTSEEIGERTKFQFYVNPFYLGRIKGYFEPRVYAGFHTVTEVKVSKLLTLKTSKKCEYALFLLKRAKKMLSLAQEEFHAANYGLSLHFSRFTIELSLKSIYPIFGITFEKVHDIVFSENLRRRVLKEIPDFPFSKLVWICQQHVRPARMDFYGDELGFTPASSIVEKSEADKAINDGQYCYENATLLFDSFQKEN